MNLLFKGFLVIERSRVFSLQNDRYKNKTLIDSNILPMVVGKSTSEGLKL